LTGRPATSIAWGPWSDIGLAAAGAHRGDRLRGRALDGIAEDEALAALEWLVGHDRPSATVMRFDAPAWLAADPAATGLGGDLGETTAAAGGAATPQRGP